MGKSFLVAGGGWSFNLEPPLFKKVILRKDFFFLLNLLLETIKETKKVDLL